MKEKTVFSSEGELKESSISEAELNEGEGSG